MKLVDMKLPKKNKEQMEKMMAPAEVERDRWPYGLQLRFESDQVNKIPILEKVEIGEKIHVMGIGEVTSIHMNERMEGKKEYTVEVQIKQVGVESMDKKSESMGDAVSRYQKSHTMKMNED